MAKVTEIENPFLNQSPEVTPKTGITNPKIEIIENPVVTKTNYEEDPLDPVVGVAANWQTPLDPKWLTASYMPPRIENPRVTPREPTSEVTAANAKENPYKEDVQTPKVNLEGNIIQGLSGAGVQVVLEFPANDFQSSVYFVANDILTVSHSVSRSKLPVTTLGEVSMSGISIGSRMVAGSIIKLFSRYDSLSSYVKTFVATRWDKLNEESKKNISDTGTSISFKEFSDYMRDDISPFNIHLVNTVETLLPKDTEKDASVPRVSSIIGATIINNGKVFSIENLITEETLSFVAKTVIYSTDNLKPSNKVTAMKGSDLLRGL